MHNYADESGGYMNLLDATANSVNTIYAQLVDIVGAQNVAATAYKMGITTSLQPVCSITLGTQAVNPLEMTSGYATLAARGMRTVILIGSDVPDQLADGAEAIVVALKSRTTPVAHAVGGSLAALAAPPPRRPRAPWRTSVQFALANRSWRFSVREIVALPVADVIV